MKNLELKDIACILRRDVLEMTTRAKSGHPTSCLSVAEIMAVLFFDELTYDVSNPDELNNDEFILSKGHAAPILYSALFRAKATKESLFNLRKLGSMYEGHPTPHSYPWAKVATGSLGQGLSVGVGMALASKKQKLDSRIYVLCGDGEVAEGSIYEAIAQAVHEKLDNFVAIVDINHYGLAGETMLAHHPIAYKHRFEAFGAKVIQINGHDIAQVKSAFKQARTYRRPVVILADTIKGCGIEKLFEHEKWDDSSAMHGKVLNEQLLRRAFEVIPECEMPLFKIKKPKQKKSLPVKKIKLIPNYADAIATRQAYGEALKKLAKEDKRVYALDAEVKHSTFSEKIEEVNTGRFIECFIAEQNMVGMALGMAVKGLRPYASTFAAFFNRAHDQLRIASLSETDVVFVGSHAGVSIGEDGPTQMGLEDIALFRAMPQSTIFYPSDAIATEKLMELAHKQKGLVYLRTSRPTTPLYYKKNAKFTLGGFGVIRQPVKSKVVLAGCGVTLEQAVIAQKELSSLGISACVVDIYSISPFDHKAFNAFVKKHGGSLVVVEDHYEAGGVGEMISSKLDGKVKVTHLCVRKMPRSGTGDELLAFEQIDSVAIVAAAKKLARCKK